MYPESHAFFSLFSFWRAGLLWHGFECIGDRRGYQLSQCVRFSSNESRGFQQTSTPKSLMGYRPHIAGYERRWWHTSYSYSSQCAENCVPGSSGVITSAMDQLCVPSPTARSKKGAPTQPAALNYMYRPEDRWEGMRKSQTVDGNTGCISAGSQPIVFRLAPQSQAGTNAAIPLLPRTTAASLNSIGVEKRVRELVVYGARPSDLHMQKAHSRWEYGVRIPAGAFEICAGTPICRSDISQISASAEQSMRADDVRYTSNDHRNSLSADGEPGVRPPAGAFRLLHFFGVLSTRGLAIQLRLRFASRCNSNTISDVRSSESGSRYPIDPASARLSNSRRRDTCCTKPRNRIGLDAHLSRPPLSFIPAQPTEHHSRSVGWLTTHFTPVMPSRSNGLHPAGLRFGLALQSNPKPKQSTLAQAKNAALWY
ncbi:hypothetical protein FB451DRAFT_1163860 [Mycena latifolia]|nr:hypothetical protein FB451DRAFT_1163860 [Mycena latifolia]